MFGKVITLCCTIFFSCTLSSQVFAQADELSMDDFAYGVELTAANSDVRQFSLTPIMMKDVERGDLGDVRVFDYYNNLMPMKVVETDSHIKTYRQALDFNNHVKAGEVRGFVLERPKDHKHWLKSLHLKWKKGAVPKVLLLRVEHSADRKNWKILKKAEVVSNYQFGGTLLKHNVIDINNYTDRFLRLVFAHTKHVAPLLQSVDSYITNTKPLDLKWITTGKLKPVLDKPGSYILSTGKAITPRLMNLHFNRLNTVLSGSLYGMTAEGEKSRWKLVSENYSSYKVTLNNKVMRSRPVKLDQLNASKWKIVTNAEVEFPEQALPDVMVAYPAYDVLFAAKGYEPYTLVWGNPHAGVPGHGEMASDAEIAVVHRGRFMDNTVLTEVVESRQFMLIVTILGLALMAVVVVVGIFYYRRSLH